MGPSDQSFISAKNFEVFFERRKLLNQTFLGKLRSIELSNRAKRSLLFDCTFFQHRLGNTEKKLMYMWDVEMAKYLFFLEWNNNYFRKMIELAGKC